MALSLFTTWLILSVSISLGEFADRPIAVRAKRRQMPRPLLAKDCSVIEPALRLEC